MNLTKKQLATIEKIKKIAPILGIDPALSTAVAMTESSLGISQLSPTGCKGVFQMSMIAMKDLWLLMQEDDDDFADIMCGMLYLRLLLKRWKTIDAAVQHYCDPKVKEEYLEKVKGYMEVFA